MSFQPIEYLEWPKTVYAFWQQQKTVKPATPLYALIATVGAGVALGASLGDRSPLPDLANAYLGGVVGLVAGAQVFQLVLKSESKK